MTRRLHKENMRGDWLTMISQSCCSLFSLGCTPFAFPVIETLLKVYENAKNCSKHWPFARVPSAFLVLQTSILVSIEQLDYELQIMNCAFVNYDALTEIQSFKTNSLHVVFENAGAGFLPDWLTTQIHPSILHSFRYIASTILESQQN